MSYEGNLDGACTISQALAGWLEKQLDDDTMTHRRRGDLLALIGHAAQQQVQQAVCDFAKLNASKRSVL